MPTIVRDIPRLFRPYPWQRRIIADPARLIEITKARQIGGSEAVVNKAVRHAFATGQAWLFLSADEETADAMVDKKARRYVEAFCFAAERKTGRNLWRETWISGDAITLPNGGLIHSRPASVASARSWTGNLVLDEFAHHRKAKEIFAAAAPMAARGGYRVIVISSPRGKGTEHYRIHRDPRWSHHRIDVHQAVRQGAPIDIEAERAKYDELTWRQEFECEFLDEVYAFFPYDLIRTAQSPQATMALPAGYRPPDGADLYLGWDIARMYHLSVFVLIEAAPIAGSDDKFITVRAVEAMRQVGFDEQLARLRGYVELPNFINAHIDESGLGKYPVEKAQKLFGGRIRPVRFTNEQKGVLAVTLRDAFERGQIHLPADRDLEEDLHSLQRTIGKSGLVRFEGQAGESHADRTWALAMAVYGCRRPRGIGIVAL